MTGFKKGTGNIDLPGDDERDESEEQTTSSEPKPDMSTTTDADIDLKELPYLVERQMRGKSVNADRTKQLLLEVRPHVERAEDELLSELKDDVDGPVHKGDVREAMVLIAQENPELIAKKLREWGVDNLEK